MDGKDEADPASMADGENSRSELCGLDLGRFELADEDMPLHQQPKYKSQQPLMRYTGRANPSPNLNKRVHKLKLARLSQLDKETKAKLSRSVQTAHVKSWLHAHGYVVKADKLHPAVVRVIEEWFSLVDQDGSRTLEHQELLAALKAAQIPCSDETIQEMIDMMDMNKDGVIGWDEFEVFMTEEFAAGKSLLSGEYLLPSGTSLNFGVMIGKLKRNKLLRDIMEDTQRRSRWATIASNPDQLNRELATMQEAVDAASLTMEHVKRRERARLEGISQQQAQLTAALVRAIDESRRAARGPEPVRKLTEKLRAGVLPPPPTERPRQESFQAAPSEQQQQQQHQYQQQYQQQIQAHQYQHQQLGPPSHGRPTRGGTAPDPSASPRAPTVSEGDLSACSSLEPLMRLHMHLSAPVGGGGGGGSGGGEDHTVAGWGPTDGGGTGGAERLAASASAPATGPGSVPSYNSQAVARYLAPHQSDQQSNHSATPPPPPSLMAPAAASCPLAWPAAPGAKAAPAQRMGSGSGALPSALSQTATPPAPPAATASYGSRRSSDAPSSVAGGAPPRHHAPSSPAAWSEPPPSSNHNRCASASRLLAAVAAAGIQHDRSLSPGQGRSGHGGAPEPHYLTTGTVSSRAHARQSKRVIRQVGLLARELRYAPGRFATEPPGLPAAVLAATRGHWNPYDGGAGGGTSSGGTGSGGTGSGGTGGGGTGGGGTSLERSLRSTADGFAASSRSTSGYGAPGTTVVPPLQQHRSGGALAPPAAPPPCRAAQSLPVLPHTGQLAQFLDSVFTSRKGEVAGGAAGGGSSTVDGAAPGPGPGASGRGAAAASVGGHLWEASSLPAPMRLLAAAAWQPADAPRPPSSPRGDSTSLPMGPRASWPSRRRSSTTADAAAAAATAAAATGQHLASQLDGGGKALKPTSARSRAGLASATDGGYGGGGRITPTGSPAAGRASPATTGVTLGVMGSAAAAATIGADASGGVAPAAAAAAPDGSVAGGFWQLGSDDGCIELVSSHGPAGGRLSPPRSASPSGSGSGSGGGAARCRVGRHPAQAKASGDGSSGGTAAAGLYPWLSGQLRHGVAGAGGGASSPSLSFQAPPTSLSAAAPSSDGRTNDGTASSRAAAGSPGRSALAFIASLESRPPSRSRTAHGTRPEKEDGDPGWQAAAASLLQLHRSQRLDELDS